MVRMGYSGARGTLIYEKNLKAKISYQTPFKAKGCIEKVKMALYVATDVALML